MKGPPLVDLSVRQLAHIFSPPGLPLPFKGATSTGTTSILIRGGAGTGKTTLALALAHAIAKEGDGLVLYLTTEFSPVEIAFKATLIGLSEESVDVWPGAASAPSGSVVVQHLSEVRDGKPVLSNAERRRSSIDAVWGLLHPEKDVEKLPLLPVRAVVIDALTLPEQGEDTGAQRAELVAFVQALESEGRSALLVEEMAHGAAAWPAFVVDIVIELSFVPDPETHELRRKLTLSKSRYAISSPGPHDYGLDAKGLSVWPNLFRVVTGGRGHVASNLPKVSVPDIFVPLPEEDLWQRLASSIVLSPYNKISGSAVRLLHSTPGIRMMPVICGAMTSIGDIRQTRVYDNEGAHAIGWAILKIANAAKQNACLFENLEGLHSRPGWLTPITQMLEALSSIGFLVCINGPRSALRPLFPLATYVWEGTYRGGAIPPQRSWRASQLRRLSTMAMLADKPESQAAWNDLYTGKQWRAARTALAAAEAEDSDPTLVLLWKAICAAVAANRQAVDALKVSLGTPHEPLVIDAILRGLARTNQVDEADRIISDLGTKDRFPVWMLHRMRADARLGSPDVAVIRDSLVHFESSIRAGVASELELADTHFNLGVALDQIGKRDEAIEAFERAAAQDPKLKVAREEIERLRASK